MISKRFRGMALCGLALALLTACAPAAKASPAFAFQDAITFGMTEDQVAAIEGRDPDAREEGAALVYRGVQVHGLSADLHYAFVEGGLRDILCLMTAEYADPSLYIADYDALQAALTARYGNPALRSNDRPDQAAEADQCSAIARGDVRRLALWQLEDATISLRLEGLTTQPRLLVLYADAAVKP